MFAKGRRMGNEERECLAVIDLPRRIARPSADQLAGVVRPLGTGRAAASLVLVSAFWVTVFDAAGVLSQELPSPLKGLDFHNEAGLLLGACGFSLVAVVLPSMRRTRQMELARRAEQRTPEMLHQVAIEDDAHSLPIAEISQSLVGSDGLSPSCSRPLDRISPRVTASTGLLSAA